LHVLLVHPSNDQNGFNDCFHLIDFMRTMGLAYPLGDSGEVLGKLYLFKIPSGE
jgi:hypothetical protein